MEGVRSVCDRILIGNRGWPGTCNIDQAGLEFGPVFLLLPLGYRDYVPEPLALKVSYFESPPGDAVCAECSSYGYCVDHEVCRILHLLQVLCLTRSFSLYP